MLGGDWLMTSTRRVHLKEKKKKKGANQERMRWVGGR